ncbi:sec-independent protein translocase protein TatA [Nakamurella panacisegetis]|uniref:Sec-independent protein translocase protein TatA n=1 Tax=Nakamurella panacisegetis TaxID=1090615 RepID=A0A1H0Q670_9ACTN|nr:Sec-independent protein translocase subunit TatA [Nakamurella panacisegetis]SDP12650.1 sec-independent protein translocase protein TatA [Nakamurella panacisegetis]
MGGLQPWHIILIVVVFLLLFGGKKLPDAARGLGRSLRILKSEVGAMHEDDGTKAKTPTETDATSAVPTPPSQIAPVPLAQPVVTNPVAQPTPAPVVQQVPVVPTTVAPPVINVPANGPHAG